MASSVAGDARELWRRQLAPPSVELRSMATVCRSMRELCHGDHHGERHMTNKWGHILGRAAKDKWRTHLASVSESGGHVRPSCTRPLASHLRPSRTRTPASCRQSCRWLRRLCSSTRSPSCSRYCRSAPRARHCYTSRATPAMLLTALPEVACRAVLRLPVGVLDAAQGRGAAAFNRRRGKKGNRDGRNRERR